MKIKNLFNTPLKASLSIVSLIAIITMLSTGTVYAASAIVQKSSIGAENAMNFSFADAGIDPVTAKEVTAEFDYEQGQFVYEVKFIADGTEYEYWINASDGAVVKKNIEIMTLSGTKEELSAQITLEKAKEIALNDAKVTGNSITFTTAKLDTEDGMSVYELEFYTENVEYEYEINAHTGAIYSKSKEIQTEKKSSTATASQATQPANREKAENTAQSNDKDTTTNSSTTKQQTTANLIGLDAAKSKALADANVSASSVTYTEAKLDYDDGIALYEIEFYTSSYEYEYEINAATGKILDKSIESLEKNTGYKQEQSKTDESDNKDTSGTYIGVDKAKSIAVNHAGFSKSGVTFSKAKLDTDDGKTVYDIEFYKGGMEYEYEIDASSGKILEFDKEQDD